MNRSAVIGVLVIALAAAGAIFLLRRPTLSDDLVTISSTIAPTTTSFGTTATGPPSETTTTLGAAAAYTPVFEETSCDFDLFTDRDHRCGYLVVPENRTDPQGTEVRIHVAIFSSDNPDAPTDPIVYLDGGPGGESLEPLAFSLEDPWADFIANRDVIFFDQRGIGTSQPNLDCVETRQLTFDTLDDDLTEADYLKLEISAISACHDRLVDDGIDLTQYNSATNAADVADLRVALGYDEWNLLGISYGTRLAQTVMRDHPEGVRSVILDSAYPPDVNLFSELPTNFDRALDVLIAGCAADAACSSAYPDLGTRLFALADELDANPITTGVRDIFTNDRYDAIVNGQVLIDTVFQGLYSAEVIPLLPQLIAEMEQGDTSTITLLLTNQLANGAFISDGMYLSVQCNEEVVFTTEEDVRAGAAAHPELESKLVDGLVGFLTECNLWESGSADPIEDDPISSDIPTLVMAGEYDPITPPRWGMQTASALSNATYVEFPGVGHATSVADDCPLAVALAFFDEPTAEVDSGCAASMSAPDFAVPGTAAPPPVNLVPFEEDVFGITITGVVPDDWDSVGVGAWARQSSFIDQTTIIQQAAPGAGDPDILIGLFASQLGFAEDPIPLDDVAAGGRTWKLYEGDIDGFTTIVALGAEGSVTGIVVLVAPPDELATLRSDVLLPVLEAFAAS